MMPRRRAHKGGGWGLGSSVWQANVYTRPHVLTSSDVPLTSTSGQRRRPVDVDVWGTDDRRPADVESAMTSARVWKDVSEWIHLVRRTAMAETES